MTTKSKLTNSQLEAIGFKRDDHGEITHENDKIKANRKKDNVKPEP